MLSDLSAKMHRSSGVQLRNNKVFNPMPDTWKSIIAGETATFALPCSYIFQIAAKVDAICVLLVYVTTTTKEEVCVCC